MVSGRSPSHVQSTYASRQSNWDKNIILWAIDLLVRLGFAISNLLMMKGGDGLSTTTHNDVDSKVSFEDDADEEIYTTSIEEEDWIEYMKRSTKDAKEKMESAKIRCWNKTHKKMKWKLALRIATSPSDRWLRKAADRNPELSSRYKKYRSIGRPRKDGKMTSTNPSNKNSKILKTQSKAAIKPTKHASA